MVLDFGFLKELMVNFIDGPCDHGMILYIDDPVFKEMFLPTHDNHSLDNIRGAVEARGFWSGFASHKMKVYIVPFIPTAEELAKHWFDRLEKAVSARSNNNATLHNIKVWETPNCFAIYP